MKETKYRYVTLLVITSVFFVNMMDRSLTTTLLPYIQKDLHLSTFIMGLVVSSFFLTFIVGNIVGGYFTDKLGGRIVLQIITISFTVITACTGFITNGIHLLLVRLGLGLVEAPDTSLSYGFIARWFPKWEQGRANALFSSASILSGVATPLIAFPLLSIFGSWRPVFYVMIIPGIVLAILIWFFAYNSPKRAYEKGKMSEGEYQKIVESHIQTNTGDTTEKIDKQFVKSILKEKQFWVVTVILFAQLSVSYGSGLWMTSYLINGLHVATTKVAGISVLPALGALLGAFFTGTISDKVTKGNNKGLVILSFLLLALAYVTIAQIQSVDYIGVLILALAVTGFMNVAIYIIGISFIQRKYPANRVSTVIGVSNGIAQTGSFLIPSLSGALIINNGGNVDFHFVFLLFSVIALVGSASAFFLKQSNQVVILPSVKELK